MRSPHWPEVSIFEPFLRLLKEIKLKSENSTTLFHESAHSYILTLTLTFLLVYFSLSGRQVLPKHDKSSWICSARLFPSLTRRFLGAVNASHLQEQRRKSRWIISILLDVCRNHHSMLLRCGDIEKNPGPTTPKMKALKIIHLNARSLLCRMDEVRCLVSAQRPDILAISESWLGPSVSDAEVSLPGYFMYRADRSRSGGGVAVYVINHLSVSTLPCGVTSDHVEALWLSISSFKSSLSHFSFGCLYRPPSAPSSSITDLCSILESMLLSHKHVVACGDLNIDTSDTTHPHSFKIISELYLITSCLMSHCPSYSYITDSLICP